MILRAILVVVAFAYVLAFALMRAASLADRRLEAMRDSVDMSLPARRRPKPYDWAERGDFDADR